MSELNDFTRTLPGRCRMCGWHIGTMGHEPTCSALVLGAGAGGAKPTDPMTEFAPSLGATTIRSMPERVIEDVALPEPEQGPAHFDVVAASEGRSAWSHPKPPVEPEVERPW